MRLQQPLLEHEFHIQPVLDIVCVFADESTQVILDMEMVLDPVFDLLRVHLLDVWGDVNVSVVEAWH